MKTLTQINKDNTAILEALQAVERLNSIVHGIDTTEVSPSVLRRIDRLKRIGDEEWSKTFGAIYRD